MLKTSVVVCTYNRPDGVVRLLESLRHQTYPPVDVIIVDQSKKNEIKSAIEKFKKDVPNLPFQINHQAVTFQGLTKSRNHGLSCSKTEITTFIDDDVEVGPQYIQGAIDFFNQKKGVIISGYPRAPGETVEDSLPVPPKVWLQYRKIFRLYRPGLCWKVEPHFEVTFLPKAKELVSSDYMSGSNFSVVTDIAKQVGFDEKLIWYSIGEDIDFPLRVKKNHPQGVWMSPLLPVIHHETFTGRLYSEFLLTVHVCHQYYLFYKHWDHRFLSTLVFAWSRVGTVLMPCLQHRWLRLIPRPDILWRSIKVEFNVLAHLKSVIAGSFPISY